MNARIALGKVLGMVLAAGLSGSLLASDANAAGWYGMPVVISQGAVVTAAVPYTTYGSYGGGGPATIYRPVSSYPATYSNYYSSCPGGNCPLVPSYNTNAMYYGANSAACPNGQCFNAGNCANGQCFPSSTCPNGNCYPPTIGKPVYPASYYTYPASGVAPATPVYYTAPSTPSYPVNQPVYYNSGSSLPVTAPTVGSSLGGADSPFYP